MSRVKALILAGGFGKRLRPLTLEKPKPLIEVGPRSILEWQILWLKSYGIKDIVLAVGYLRSKIFEAIGDGSRLGVRVYYSVEEEPLGTGGAIKHAEPFLEDCERFVVVNGDVLTNIPVDRLLNELKGDIIGAIALTPMRSPYGIVHVDENGYILEFREKPSLEYLINAGVYAFTREIFNYLPEKGDIETTTFPRLARERKLKAVIFKDVYWRSIDSIKDVEEASREVDYVFSEVLRKAGLTQQ